MAILEERMARLERGQACIEHDNTELKKTVELMNTAIGALVNKAAFEKLNEKNDKILDALMGHDQFTNQQLAELREQLTEEDGKIIGLQTEMLQRFEQQDGKFEQQDGKIVALQAEMLQHFEQQDEWLRQILDRLPPALSSQEATELRCL